MKKQAFIEKKQEEIRSIRALIHFCHEFGKTVKQFDGKVYNKRLMDSYKESVTPYTEKGWPYAYQSSAEKETGDYGTEVRAYKYEGGHVERNAYLGDSSLSKYKGDRMVTADGRISYAAFQKILADKVTALENRIAEIQSTLDRLDEYESLNDQVVKLIQDASAVIPSDIYDMSFKARVNCVYPLFD
jgi:hypothetical protein